MLDDVAALSCGPAPAPYFAPSAPSPSLSCVAFLQWALLSLLSCGTKISEAEREELCCGGGDGEEQTQEMKDRLLRVDLRIRVVACSTARGAHRLSQTMS